MARAEYRSALRSRTLIRNALLALMRDKSFDKITITEVARKANVNRGTFYAHYRNLSEVLESIQDDVTAQLGALFSQFDTSRLYYECERMLNAGVEFIKKDPDYYRMLLSIDNNNVLSLWKNNVISYLESSSFLQGGPVRKSNALRLAIRFCVSGSIDCFIDSLTGKNGIPLEALPKELARFIESVFSPFYETD